jgi:hypothetical protein
MQKNKNDIQILTALNCVQNPRLSQGELHHFGTEGVKRLVLVLNFTEFH